MKFLLTLFLTQTPCKIYLEVCKYFPNGSVICSTSNPTKQLPRESCPGWKFEPDICGYPPIPFLPPGTEERTVIRLPRCGLLIQ